MLVSLTLRRNPPLSTTFFLPLPLFLLLSSFTELLIFVCAVSSTDDLRFFPLVSFHPSFFSFSLIDSSYSVACWMDKRFSSSFLPSFLRLPSPEKNSWNNRKMDLKNIPIKFPKESLRFDSPRRRTAISRGRTYEYHTSNIYIFAPFFFRLPVRAFYVLIDNQ